MVLYEFKEISFQWQIQVFRGAEIQLPFIVRNNYKHALTKAFWEVAMVEALGEGSAQNRGGTFLGY